MVLSPLSPPAKPNYPELVAFLLKPFLTATDSVSLDHELTNQQSRVWLRVAVESEDKGRVFGRGGRNLQAIRAVVTTAAALAGQSVFFDVYDSEQSLSENGSGYAPRRRRAYTPYGATPDNDRTPRRRSRPRFGSEPAF